MTESTPVTTTSTPTVPTLADTLQNLYHFIISLVVLVGGGIMAYNGKADGLAPAAIGAVLVFWFQRSGTGTSIISTLTGIPTQSGGSKIP